MLKLTSSAFQDGKIEKSFGNLGSAENMKYGIPQTSFPLAWEARIVHVIGTTGCSATDEDKIHAAARHPRARSAKLRVVEKLTLA